MKENSGLTDEEVQCIKTDNITKLNSYMNATQAYLDNIGELHMPQQSESIPVQLLEAGFDVWMEGNRGTKFQRGHSKKGNSKSNFWKFTLNDMARYDQTAQINYITEYTKQDKLSYIGYSSGNTQMYWALGMQDELPEMKSALETEMEELKK